VFPGTHIHTFQTTRFVVRAKVYCTIDPPGSPLQLALEKNGLHYYHRTPILLETAPEGLEVSVEHEDRIGGALVKVSSG
jgi:hypothetical protein